MGEQEKKKTIGMAELIEFGEYLNSLRGTDRTFELEDAKGQIRDCTLDEAIQAFQNFFDRRTESLRVRIGYVDYQGGTMGHTTTEFKRVSKP